MAYIDEKFCARVGTDKQHRLTCYLASRLGYSTLRDAVSAATGMSVSKCGRTVITVRQASEIIDWLKAKQEDSKR